MSRQLTHSQQQVYAQNKVNSYLQFMHNIKNTDSFQSKSTVPKLMLMQLLQDTFAQQVFYD